MNVQFDEFLLLTTFKKIEWGPTRDEKNSAELELIFNREMLDCQMALPVVGQRLVQLSILADVIRVADKLSKILTKN